MLRYGDMTYLNDSKKFSVLGKGHKVEMKR